MRTVLVPRPSLPGKTDPVLTLPLTPFPVPAPPFLPGLFWTVPICTNPCKVNFEWGDQVFTGVLPQIVKCHGEPFSGPQFPIK